jgi:sortase A
MRLSRWLGRILIVIGCACLSIVAIGMREASSFQQAAAQALQREMAAAEPPEPTHGDLIGRLEIPRLDLSVIVTEGDDDATLALAVGHLPDTPFPWQAGNSVFAGHRDTFFRPLKDIREGDEIRMTTARGTFEYHVIRTEIVDPANLTVLAPTPGQSLTLVTCYPFVYVGRAPQRFIIQAQ